MKERVNVCATKRERERKKERERKRERERERKKMDKCIDRKRERRE